MRVLFVCLGNICRSPTAEGVLRRIAADEAPDLQLTIDSAGTADYHIGAHPDPRSCAHAARRGYVLDELRARQVVAEDFRDFDLILAMDEDNLRDLQAIAPHDARARIALFLDFAPGAAGRPVPDPYYGKPADFDKVLDLIEAAARGLLVSIRSGRAVGLRHGG
jgi:low molecular weight protein-tyrosine phosphatase